MLYNSLSFAVFFLGVLGVYWGLRNHRARLTFLLLASWLFYAAWYPKYLLLFLLVTAMTYAAGLWIAEWANRAQAVRRRIVIGAVVIDLAVLAYFKYGAFLLSSAAAVARVAGADVAPPLLHIILPLGISFYTFQSIAYVVDVYRGEVPAIRNPLKLALFKAFFPQLIAGPIVRASELIPQFVDRRRADPAQIADGLDLIAMGLVKKVMIADRLSGFVDRVFAHPQGLSSASLWLAVYAYAAQIFCDFSGYTDIGRGCAKLLGYDLPINFDAPYASVNIVDFWRRWHITLSRWLRDYLYIPLGGSRRGKVRTYVNLILTMVLGGLWHGASWTFVAWGAFHGISLAVTRLIHDIRGVPAERPLFRGRLYRAGAVLVTFHLVCLGWVLFRAPTFEVARVVTVGLFQFTRFGPADIGSFGWITLMTVGTVLAVLFAIHLALATAAGRVRMTAVPRGVCYAIVIAGLALFASGGAPQFIYFQF
jgi:alginate O-acetyltransferase complex protein AlgI